MSFYNLDEKSKTCKQPDGLIQSITLRPHQLTSIAAMRDLEDQASVIIDKPTQDSGLYQTIRYKVQDIGEFTGSTFIFETNSAILADKVGSGKTYMIIGLILSMKVPPPHRRFIIGTDHYSVKMLSVKECVPVNLIVVPHNLANQWGTFVDNSTLRYIKLNTVSDFDIFLDIEYTSDWSLTGYDNIVSYNLAKKQMRARDQKEKKEAKGSKTSKKKPIANIYEKKTFSNKKFQSIMAQTDVIILNVNRYNYFRKIFKSVTWARVIIDEMDSAKVPATFHEFGNFNWFVTATPTSIFQQSCRTYVNRIFGYNQHLLEYFTIKNTDAYVDTSLVLPDPIVFRINTLLHKVITAIQDMIPADVLQMINAGNMKEAVTKLNCNVDTEENIIGILTDTIKTEKHNLEAELAYVTKLKMDADAHEKRLNKIRAEITRCNNRLQMVDDRMKSIKDECCFICADTFDTPAILNCCKSVFCLKCLLAALKQGDNKCPYCRTVLKSNKEYHVISKTKSKIPLKPIKAPPRAKAFSAIEKAEALEKVLVRIAENSHLPRILIFSDYKQTFDKIIKFIAKSGLTYDVLAGIPAHINNLVADFKKGTVNILMLDSSHYGSGLNLQDADYVILFHRMTPEMETQVIGRAQRFGRVTPLKIIYLLNPSEQQNFAISDNVTDLISFEDLHLIINADNKNDNRQIDAIPVYEDSESEEDMWASEEYAPRPNKKKKVIVYDTESESESDSDSDADPDLFIMNAVVPAVDSDTDSDVAVPMVWPKTSKSESEFESDFDTDSETDSFSMAAFASADTDTDTDSDTDSEEEVVRPRKSSKAKSTPAKKPAAKRPVKKSAPAKKPTKKSARKST